MANKITTHARLIFIGGSNVFADQPAEIDINVFELLNTKSLLIIDLSGHDLACRNSMKPLLSRYFTAAGVSEVKFFSDMFGLGSAGVSQYLSEFENIYLPGGDTATLLRNIADYGITESLVRHGGTLIGNSAGAIAFCSAALLTPDDDVKELTVLEGLGLVNFSVDPHYDESHDQYLIPHSSKFVTYGIGEESALVLGEELSAIGEVYRFIDGKKERLKLIA